MTTATIRARAAHQRGLEAGQRALELSERRERMKQQRSPSTADVLRARRAFVAALEHSSAALSNALEARWRSGVVHRRVAAAYEAVGDLASAAMHSAAAAECERVVRGIMPQVRPPAPAIPDVGEGGPCPQCGSEQPVPVGTQVQVCVDCGHVWREWSPEAACLVHIWVTREHVAGRSEVEEQCAACGEIRLLAQHRP